MCERSSRLTVTYLRTLGTLSRRPSLAIAFALLVALHVARPIESAAQTGIITTMAGTGTGGFSGDGGPATSAQFDNPGGLALDGTGNLFIADNCNQRIRKVDLATGIVTTVAGNGSTGCGNGAFAGDGGPATSAKLGAPSGVALDGSGNLFIAEQCNHRIRKVDLATGTITTVAGSGPTGCGAGGFAGDGGPATSAQLFLPFSVSVDGSGNLFIADSANHRIRKVAAQTGIITTVVGTGIPGFGGDGGPATSAQLDGPLGIALDGSGNLFIADRFNNRIRKVDLATAIITTVAGSGPTGIHQGGFGGDGGLATSARLFEPSSIAVDGTGNLFIGDVVNRRVRKVAAGTAVISTVAGTGTNGFGGDGGPATSAQLTTPYGLVVDGSGNVFIADSANHRVRVVPMNHPPTADAGPDQSVSCSDVVGTVVTLSGFASSDPDGDSLTYTWTGPFPEGAGTVTGVNPSVTLPLGTSTITLVVNDGHEDSAADTVDVTVAVAVQGLLPPLDRLVIVGDLVPLPGKAFKLGATIPLRLLLFCGGTALSDADVAPPAIVRLFRGGDPIHLDILDLDAGEANDDNFAFRYSEPNWVYNLSTKQLQAGTYIITMETPDGLRYDAGFVVR